MGNCKSCRHRQRSMSLRKTGNEGRRIAEVGKSLLSQAKEKAAKKAEEVSPEADRRQAKEEKRTAVSRLGGGRKDSKKPSKKAAKKQKENGKGRKDKKDKQAVLIAQEPEDTGDLRKTVERAVFQTPVVDLHTHLYPPQFGELNQWGVDHLITYHYLIAEFFRYGPDISPDEFFALPLEKQADRIWRTLFVENTPISEACRGVLTCLRNLGIDASDRTLKNIREAYSDMVAGAKDPAAAFAERVFETSNVRQVVMTNDPFDRTEREKWLSGPSPDSRYRAALRIDPLLLDWRTAHAALQEMGYEIDFDLTQRTVDAVRYFLHDWAERIHPLYCAVSLPPDFHYPEASHTTAVLEKCILPFAEERGMPFAIMMGVTRQVNPALRVAGDSVGRSDLSALGNLRAAYPDNRFMVTLLSRENQHELCVLARKFGNLMPFGCWWFTNIPSVIEEITRERVELLGFTFAPQHSDARVLDQLLYKWPHSRRVIAEVLVGQYTALARTGWTPTPKEIRRDVEALLSGNFLKFAGAL